MPDSRDRAEGDPSAVLLSDQLLRLWHDMQHLPARHVDAGLEYLLERLGQMLQADRVEWSLFGLRSSGVTWCMASHCHPRGADEALSANGPVLRFTLAVRTGVHMNFMVMRHRGRQAFNSQDQAHLSAALSGLYQWLQWLALSHGPVEADAPLPTYQRRVLMLLLTGLSEKQMAHELDLSINTVHQYVTALYRGFGVRNRQSLAAKWLGENH